MLQLKNIRKSYDGKVILDSISLDINDGEIVSILVLPVRVFNA